ncbi:MAG: iron ABC transporter permease [Rubrivivax sp.]|nr:iron ABC transporter permease [Rubrivivax sp.]
MERPLDAARARQRLLLMLALGGLAGLLLGLMAGSEGLSWASLRSDATGPQAAVLIGEIRAPRTLGAALVGALLGLGGALAQGVFRNPLADPYLLGSAAGASLGVVMVLALGAGLGGLAGAEGWLPGLQRLGVVGAAFLGALAGVGLTLLLSRGAQQTLRLLLAGIVVGVLLTAVNELLTTLSLDALRGRQQFLLGSTALLGWGAVGWMAAGLAIALPLALRASRVLDALTLGEDSAASLGLNLARWRLGLLALMALCTGLAVAHAGLIAFVGLVAPHVVRRLAPSAHGFLLVASAATGAVLLLIADVLARALMAPQELPVGLITAVLGGLYLVWLLQSQERR